MKGRRTTLRVVPTASFVASNTLYNGWRQCGWHAYLKEPSRIVLHKATNQPRATAGRWSSS